MLMIRLLADRLRNDEGLIPLWRIERRLAVGRGSERTSDDDYRGAPGFNSTRHGVRLEQ
jgi:hypothetical protein